MNILFVCTGNTCRSCMAEAIAKNEAEKRNLNLDIASAGIYAFAGDGPSINSVRVMEEMGLDVACHIATPLSEEILENSDLVLTMTEGHKLNILKNNPSLGSKVFTMLEYIGEEGDIADPFGGDISVYRECANQIKITIEKIFEKIKES